MNRDPSFIFCRIVAGEIPSRKAYEDDELLAFHDIHPWAPVHVLVIPKEHVASLADVDDGHAPDREPAGPREGAVVREPPLLFGTEHAHRHPGRPREGMNERAGGTSLAAGCSHDRASALGALGACEPGVAPGHAGDGVHRSGTEPSTLRDLGPEAEALAALEDGGHPPARGDVGDEQARRVRPYVDDGDAHRGHRDGVTGRL